MFFIIEGLKLNLNPSLPGGGEAFYHQPPLSL
jgi:hypothetical protein